MKNQISLTAITVITVAFLFIFLEGCKKDEDDTPPIQGSPGNPRFNLQFTNEENVDLDLHVLTPNGIEIYYANDEADGGRLDVDCLCGDCPNGPNENIFWVEGTAPRGQYEFWVEYYEDCNGTGASSQFTLRRMINQNVHATYTGTLSGGESQRYSFTY